LPVPVGGQLDNFDEDAIPLMQQAGMTWIKWQIPFVIGDSSLITVARDRINWSHQHGFYAFLSVKGNKDELGQQGSAYYPLYAEFVGQLAALQPDAIQVWNEMNLDREWPQGQIDPRAYIELLRQAHDAIKAVDPTIKVVTGAPSPTGAEGAFGLDRVWNDDRYYLGMANAGAAQYADCIGIHYNEGIISPRQQGGDPRGDYPPITSRSCSSARCSRSAMSAARGRASARWAIFPPTATARCLRASPGAPTPASRSRRNGWRTPCRWRLKTAAST
ncbi:MAG: hypothetical protein LC121_19000, partial [Anaerolineae bacterium]|nr:hypothetical protein [Anaerolineae bacterium]